ncbi:hypothetical protein [Acidithiobacillus caldus]|uniref:Uncharacterized protein n=1 Tax=Acidithiobacillus caldus TaxID=33059 RepID=A0A1E7YPJ1_9PROT|nr:hypothetical protein [Acidithiobacillus caldus]OFC36552.1 hypothetical protein BAE28_08510 [Acidithiobacillus caldus]OFC37699.1 hypothetical protein BAE27_03775 [Acidithiobacillus caldus]OFC39681.1 hypothetical protein BAE29_06705 [Acidithiobacillus caldus]
MNQHILRALVFSILGAGGLWLYAASSYAESILSLRAVEAEASKTPVAREKYNDILASKDNIAMLRAESSAIFQGRVTLGRYTHFNYDGIPRGYVAKPKIGFKYYLFGGNKYLRHIIDQAQPEYYKQISAYDKTIRDTKLAIAKAYLSYWSSYTLEQQYARLFKDDSYARRMARKLGGIFTRMRLSIYLQGMKSRIALHNLSRIIGKQLPAFIPIVPLVDKLHKKDKTSFMRAHPGIAGLIRYYHDQKKLGLLRFVNIKFKAFVRPSYYPSAGRTKLALIAGAYINMPFDIFGAERHADAALAAERENIILKLQNDNLASLQSAKIRQLRIPMYQKARTYWRSKAKNSLRLFSHTAKTIKGGHHQKARLLARYLRIYRSATMNWVKATKRLVLATYGQ